MAESGRGPLELDGQRMRSMVDQAMERIVPHLEGLADAPHFNVAGAQEDAAAWTEPLPEKGTALEDLLDRLFDEYIPRSVSTPGPGFLGFIPGGGIFHSAVADLIANSTNRYVGSWYPAPFLVQVEQNVVRWFCQMLGYPDTAGGVLTSGGSIANMTATVAARRALLSDRQIVDAVVYTSDQAHLSVEKACMMAGVPTANVRSVSTDDELRMRVDHLEEMLARDKEKGLRPFLVVAAAGTTNTGAVDPLPQLADVCQREGLWFHVDAAYGGFFLLTERGRRLMTGIERSDSTTLDPHKGLGLPYGTGAMVVRDAQRLERAFRAHDDYLPERPEGQGVVDFAARSMELSRDFRGLRVWLPVRMHGIGPFREHLDEDLDLTAWLADEVSALPHARVLNRPQLSAFAYRFEPPGMDEAATDAFNRLFMDRLNAWGPVYVSATVLGGRFANRFCILSFRTHKPLLERMVARMRQLLDELLSEAPANA